MHKFYAAFLVSLLLLGIARSYGQQLPVNDVKKQTLNTFSAQARTRYQANHNKAIALANKHGWVIKGATKNGGIISLQGVNSLGFPIYLKTDNNTIAAATTGTNTVQPGGSLGLTLSGSSTFVNNKLAIWDGGSVYKAHQEFAGKTITLHDSSAVIDHATHVSGTMIAQGVYAPAKGMAFGANTLQSYDFDNDVAEMSSAASGLLLSNHSYGDAAGWYFNSTSNRWEWYGLPGDTVDYEFGFYGERTRDWDNIAYNAPYYLIVESAGNSRADTGPPVGQDYWGYKSATDQTLVDKGPRPAGISNNDGYDIIATTANAKNILTVGAVNPIPGGPTSSKDISISYFSSFGPTDDGRIKPDIVGDGVDVLSTGSANKTSYITLSGTSMAAPNITGSLYLLQEYYAQKNNGKFMLAATLKGLACHTAFDAGNPGPDYIYGWGLLDMKKAAQAITDNAGKSTIREATLQQGQTQTYHVIASGNGALMATISWTDPPGTATADGTVNSRTPKLVNDLDIRVTDGTSTFKPWVLDLLNPSVAATTGDNILDNIEEVYVPDAVAGKAYTITVSNKGTLKAGSQDYSLIMTGIGGVTYCTSAPLSNADSKINGITLSNLNYTAQPGCTTYSDHTNVTVQLEQAKTYPLSLTLGTCGANFNKAAKVFIDWNGNGVFDADELVATSNVINGTGVYTTNITVPATVTPGNYTLMRIVLTETSDVSTVSACGSYAKGETQDYRVQFLQTSIDAGISAIVNPQPDGACSGADQITVRVKNYGTQAVGNIPVVVTITAPDNTVTTLKQTYTGTLAQGEEGDFTLSSTFNAVAGASYIITAETALTGDPIVSNNAITETALISQPPTATNLAAFYCQDSKQYQLSGSGDGELLWYQNRTDQVPIGYGSPALVSEAPVDNVYYAGLNDFKGNVGPATNSVFAGGGYNQFTPYIAVNTKAPMIIESARLYIGYSGRITFTVADANGQTVSTNTIDAAATRTTPAAGVQPDDPNDQGAVYNLNLLLPAAGNYTINIAYDSDATIFRSNAGVSGYPFKIGDIFSITGNNATSDTDTAAYKSYYYYLYDIHIKSAGCPSGTRVAVPLTKPVITQNGTVLTSNLTSGNQWYLNGKAISGATSQNYTPQQSGNYQVGQALNGGCIALSDNYVYVKTNGTGNNSEIGLTVFPNPASSQLNIILAAKSDADLTLTMINSACVKMYSAQQKVTAGNFSTTADVSNLPPGTYVLRVQLGQKVYGTKVVVVR